MKLEVYNHSTDETETFTDLDEFIYWYNYVDEFNTIKKLED